MPCFLERLFGSFFPCSYCWIGGAPAQRHQSNYKEKTIPSNIDRFYILSPNLAAETELRKSAA